MMPGKPPMEMRSNCTNRLASVVGFVLFFSFLMAGAPLLIRLPEVLDGCR